MRLNCFARKLENTCCLVPLLLSIAALTAVSTRHFHIIRSVKIIYGNHILLVQGFEQDVFAFVYTLF